MRYYDQLSPKQEEKIKDWRDSPDLHHLYTSSLQQTHLLSDLIILPQILHFWHLLEDQFHRFLTLEDQADLSSSSMTTQLPHLQMHHHQHHRQENEKVHLFIDHDQQAVTSDAWQWAYQIWNLQSRKGVMLRSCYLIIIQTIFHFNAISHASSITFLCHCT